MWDTLSHAWDPAFQAPALPLGPTHTNYHAFREFTLSVGGKKKGTRTVSKNGPRLLFLCPQFFSPEPVKNAGISGVF